jgi:hypothetical protein
MYLSNKIIKDHLSYISRVKHNFQTKKYSYLSYAVTSVAVVFLMNKFIYSYSGKENGLSYLLGIATGAFVGSLVFDSIKPVKNK